MTRINVIEPHKLTDQHLFAEFREITRVSSLARPQYDSHHYTMGVGHVKFFYNKGLYLSKRLTALEAELRIRNNINFTPKSYKQHPAGLHNDWEPSNHDRAINLARLDAKIREKPDFYRYYNKPIQTNHYIR